MSAKQQALEGKISETAQLMLNETVDWAGRYLSAYAHLIEAQHNNDEDAYAQAWGDMTTALLVLKDKAEQSYELLDEDES